MKHFALAAAALLLSDVHSANGAEDAPSLPGGVPPQFVLLSKVDTKKNTVTVKVPRVTAKAVTVEHIRISEGKQVPVSERAEAIHEARWEEQELLLDSYRLSTIGGKPIRDWSQAVGKVAIMYPDLNSAEHFYAALFAKETLVLRQVRATFPNPVGVPAVPNPTAPRLTP